MVDCPAFKIYEQSGSQAQLVKKKKRINSAVKYKITWIT